MRKPQTPLHKNPPPLVNHRQPHPKNMTSTILSPIGYYSSTSNKTWKSAQISTQGMPPTQHSAGVKSSSSPRKCTRSFSVVASATTLTPSIITSIATSPPEVQPLSHQVILPQFQRVSKGKKSPTPPSSSNASKYTSTMGTVSPLEETAVYLPQQTEQPTTYVLTE